jgi:hypothetical protein
MADTSNDSYFSVTDSGSAISSSVTTLQSVNNYPAVVWASNTLSKNFPSGIALSDFLNTNNVVIDIPYDADSVNVGTMVGAISTQFNNAGSTSGFSINAWYSGGAFDTSTTPYVYYYNGKFVAIYQCIASVSSSSITPDKDTSHFTYVGQAFRIRLVPSEYSYLPTLLGSERFRHYVVCYPTWVNNAGYITSGTKSVGFTAANYTASGFNGSGSGLQNSIVVDGTNSGNSMIMETYGTISSTSVNLGIANPDQLIQPNIKVRVNALISGVSTPFTVSVTSTDSVSFSGTIDVYAANTSSTAYSSSVQYLFGDYVVYSGYVYYHKGSSPTLNVPVTNTSVWTRIGGNVTGTVDPIITSWDVYLDTDFFQSVVTPVPASANSSAAVHTVHKPNVFKYNSSVINQKQTLFSTSEYLTIEGFPIDKNSVTGASMNITAGVLNNAISQLTRPVPLTETDSNLLPLSDNRWLPIVNDFSNSSSWTSSYVWSSHNGSTVRTLISPGDADYTYLPDLLDGNASSNPKNSSSRLKLMSKDAIQPPMSAIDSLSFANKDFMRTGYDPFKVNGIGANVFTTLMTAYLDYIPSSVLNSSLSAEETNWYAIMSEAEITGTWSTDKTTLDSYTQFQPRLSVRYRYDGTITLNLGDTILTAIKVKNGVARPFCPVIVGLTIVPASGANNVCKATLTVVDTSTHRSTVTFVRNWLGASPSVPNSLLYGAAPFNQHFHGAKMYVLEINNYYGSRDNSFFDNEIKKLDTMYAITNGRSQ